MNGSAAQLHDTNSTDHTLTLQRVFTSGDGSGSLRVDTIRIRSRPSKPNREKGRNEKFMNFTLLVNSGVFPWENKHKPKKKGPKRKVHEFHLFFVNSGVFFLGKTSTVHISNFGSNVPPRKVHEPTFLWFGLPERLPKESGITRDSQSQQLTHEHFQRMF